MKSTDLRIGNWVNNNGARQIDAHDIDFCQRNSKSFNDLNSPIPLTEQWLVKFGFVNEDNKYNLYYNHGGLDDLIFLVIEPFQDKYTISIETHEMNWPYLLRGIESVHQLQNLYFALTGEEL